MDKGGLINKKMILCLKGLIIIVKFLDVFTEQDLSILVWPHSRQEKRSGLRDKWLDGDLQEEVIAWASAWQIYQRSQWEWGWTKNETCEVEGVQDQPHQTGKEEPNRKDSSHCLKQYPKHRFEVTQSHHFTSPLSRQPNTIKTPKHQRVHSTLNPLNHQRQLTDQDSNAKIARTAQSPRSHPNKSLPPRPRPQHHPNKDHLAPLPSLQVHLSSTLIPYLHIITWLLVILWAILDLEAKLVSAGTTNSTALLMNTSTHPLNTSLRNWTQWSWSP